jgi:hypothetical protein
LYYGLPFGGELAAVPLVAPSDLSPLHPAFELGAPYEPPAVLPRGAVPQPRLQPPPCALMLPPAAAAAPPQPEPDGDAPAASFAPTPLSHMAAGGAPVDSVHDSALFQLLLEQSGRGDDAGGALAAARAAPSLLPPPLGPPHAHDDAALDGSHEFAGLAPAAYVWDVPAWAADAPALPVVARTAPAPPTTTAAPAVAAAGGAAGASAAARPAPLPPPAVSELLQAFAGGADRLLASRMIRALGSMERFAAVRATMLPQQALFKVRLQGSVACCAAVRCGLAGVDLRGGLLCFVALFGDPQAQLRALHRAVRTQRALLAAHGGDAGAEGEGAGGDKQSEQEAPTAQQAHTAEGDDADDDARAAGQEPASPPDE